MTSYLLLVWVLGIVLCVSTAAPDHSNTDVNNGTDTTDNTAPGYTDGITTSKEDSDRNETIHQETDNADITKTLNNTDDVKFGLSTKNKNMSTIARIKAGQPTKDKKDMWKNYDQVGAKNFIVVTVAVYSLVGTLSLLLMRMCRRAQRIHNETDRSDELVDQYLRASMDLKAQGYKDRMLREKEKTCMTLTSIEEEQLKGQGRRARYHHQWRFSPRKNMIRVYPRQTFPSSTMTRTPGMKCVDCLNNVNGSFRRCRWHHLIRAV